LFPDCFDTWADYRRRRSSDPSADRAGKLPHVCAQGRYRFNRQAILEWALAHNHPLQLDGAEVPADCPLPPLQDFLSADRFFYDVPGTNFLEAAQSALQRFDLPAGNDKELIYELLVSREELMTTAVGDGLAIPHVRIPVVVNVSHPVVGVFFLRQPIDMAALDGQPVHTLIVLLTQSPKQHLELLARLAFFFRQPAFVRLLRERARPEKILEWMMSQASR
jgi:PTS system nitrogen regulatory IIA component